MNLFRTPVMSAVQSIERAFAILRALAIAPTGVTELAGQVELPKSTVSRLLTSLVEVGAVEKNEASLYRLGRHLTELAGAVDSSVALATAVRPHLQLLAEATGEATGFAVPDGYQALYVAQIESPNPVHVRDYTGLSVPMHVGPSGLCIMAHWPREQIRAYLTRELERYTNHTVIDSDRIERRLEAIRMEGSCWIYEEFADGINSVASPVYGIAGDVAGAVHVHGPAYRFPARDETDSVAALVRQSAERVTAVLGSR